MHIKKSTGFTYMLPLSHICTSSLHAACPSVIPSHTPVCPVSCSHTAGEKAEWAQASRQAHQTLLLSFSLSSLLLTFTFLHSHSAHSLSPVNLSQTDSPSRALSLSVSPVWTCSPCCSCTSPPFAINPSVLRRCCTLHAVLLSGV